MVQSRPPFKSALGGGDGQIKVRLGSHRNIPELFFGAWIDCLESSFGLRGLIVDDLTTSGSVTVCYKQTFGCAIDPEMYKTHIEKLVEIH